MENHFKEKIITIAAAVVLAVVLVIIVLMMLGRRSVENYTRSIEPPSPAYNYKLSLEPKEITATAGGQVKVDLIVSAYGEEINGVDAVINYDKNILEPVEAVEQSARFIVPRKMFRDDQIIITALRQLDDTKTTRTEVLATIYFNVLKKGRTDLFFEFLPGQTVGSTIIKAQKAENILKETQGASLVVE